MNENETIPFIKPKINIITVNDEYDADDIKEMLME